MRMPRLTRAQDREMVQIRKRWAAAVAAVDCPWCGVKAGEQCVGVYAPRPGEPHMTREVRYLNPEKWTGF